MVCYCMDLICKFCFTLCPLLCSISLRVCCSFSCRVEVRGSDFDQTRMQPRIVNAKNFALVDLLQESCLFVIISTAGDGTIFKLLQFS